MTNDYRVMQTIHDIIGRVVTWSGSCKVSVGGGCDRTMNYVCLYITALIAVGRPVTDQPPSFINYTSRYSRCCRREVYWCRCEENTQQPCMMSSGFVTQIVAAVGVFPTGDRRARNCAEIFHLKPAQFLPVLQCHMSYIPGPSSLYATVVLSLRCTCRPWVCLHRWTSFLVATVFCRFRCLVS